MVRHEGMAGHPAVEGQALGDVTDEALHFQSAGFPAEDADLAFVRKEEPEQAAEERRLPGSIGTDQAEDDSGLHLERHIPQAGAGLPE